MTTMTMTSEESRLAFAVKVCLARHMLDAEEARRRVGDLRFFRASDCQWFDVDTSQLPRFYVHRRPR
jgi:hypothetical protein